MRKRVLSLLLALCMIAGLLPAATISAAAADTEYYTVEQYDADGDGTMPVPPTETTNDETADEAGIEAVSDIETDDDDVAAEDSSADDTATDEDIDVAVGENETYDDNTGDDIDTSLDGLDTNVATVALEDEMSNLVAIGNLGSDSSYNGDTVEISECLYDFAQSDDGTWSITGTDASGDTVYLYPGNGKDVANGDRTAGYPNTTADNPQLEGMTISITQGHEDGSFYIESNWNAWQNEYGAYLYFSRSNLTWNRSQTLDDNTARTNASFYLYRAVADGETSSAEIPGYVRVTSVDDLSNGEYLIAAPAGSNWYVAYPSASTDSLYAQIARVSSVARDENEDEGTEVTLSGLHSAQINSFKLYTYTGSTKGDVDLLGDMTATDSKYTLSLTAGDYWVEGYDANGGFNGGVKITVADQAVEYKLQRIYELTTNSGWVKDEDYTLDVTLTDADGNDRPMTLGTGEKITCIFVIGDTVTATVTPDAEKHPTYNATTVSSKPTINTNMSVSCKEFVAVTFTAPAGSVISAGTLKNYYVYSFMTPYEESETEDGVTVTYRLDKNTDYFYRVQNPDGVTYWNYKKWSAGETIAITEDDLYIGDDSFNKETVIDDFSKNIYDRADIYLNINGAGYKNMSVGDTFELNSFRNWFAIESFMNAKVALPDMHYTVISPEGEPSDVVTITPNEQNNNVAVMTANQAGTAIVLVTYDAMTHMVGMTNTSSHQFSAIWPECTGVFVVTVGADGTGIQTNMQIDRMDAAITNDEQKALDAEHDILFYLGDEGAEYAFQPESGCTVTVARSTVTDKMTFNGFTDEGVTVAEDGTVTVSGLTTGRHIIKVEKDGVANYQVITTREVSYKLVDAAGDELTDEAKANMKAGDTINIQFTGLLNPKEKLSGAYNFNFRLHYAGEDGTYFDSNPGGAFGVYDFSGNPARQKISITIPKYWPETSYTLAAGALKQGGFAGVPTHRGITYAKGTDPQYNAPSVSGILSRLPAITIPLAETDFITGRLNFQDENGTSISREDLTITLKDGDGNAVIVAADGSFKAVAETYSYVILADGYRYSTGSIEVTPENTDFTITMQSAASNAWDGVTTTEPEMDEDGVYLIATGAELAWFSAKNQENAQDIAGKLTADIDLADYLWNNTLTYSSKTTSLDGDGHVVSGLNATRGLFGSLGGNSQIQNLTIRGSVSGGGAVTAYASGSGVVIENCVNEAVINSTGNNAGGIVGYANTGCVIRECVNTGAVTGGSYVGGIIGGFVGAATVEECYNIGAVTGSSYVGGVFGNGNYAVTIKSCYNTGAISGTSNIGGVGGALTGPSYGSGTATLSDCYSVGSVTGTTNVGGLLGSFDSSKASVTRGYYLTTAAENDPIGVALDETAMKSAELDSETFAPTCGGYPALKWQTNVTFHVPGAEAESILAPTCTEKGYSTYRCTECEEIFLKDYTAPLGHDFCEHEEVPEDCEDCVYTAPGCETEGSIVHTCRRDGCEDTKTDIIPATGHIPSDSSILIYPAYRTYTCEVCGIENIVEWNDTRLEYMTLPQADAAVHMTDTDSYPWTWNDAAQRLESSNVGVNSSTSTSAIEFTLDYGGTLKFDYAVSSERNYDKLTIMLNDEKLADAISGDVTGSVDKTLDAGTYTLTMSFSKDSSSASNSDMSWISNVEITAVPAPKQYTVELVPSKTEIDVGESFTVGVKVSGEAFNAYDITVNYDTSLFTSELDPEATGSINLTEYNKSFGSGDVVETLTFTAVSELDAVATGEFTVEKALIAVSEEALEKDPYEATTKAASVQVYAYDLDLYTDYVGGYTLVVVYGSADSYTFGGTAMFRTAYYDKENVQAFAYIVEGALTKEEAISKLEKASGGDAVVIEDTFDVNGTGSVNISDVQAVADCYNIAGTVADYIVVYLRADVNKDHQVNFEDANKVLLNRE